jgi:hypothetical protein
LDTLENIKMNTEIILVVLACFRFAKVAFVSWTLQKIIIISGLFVFAIPSDGQTIQQGKNDCDSPYITFTFKNLDSGSLSINSTFDPHFFAVLDHTGTVIALKQFNGKQCPCKVSIKKLIGEIPYEETLYVYFRDKNGNYECASFTKYHKITGTHLFLPCRFLLL